MAREEKIEEKMKEYILDDIFSERPYEINDWEIFMSNQELEIPKGFEACEEYEFENARSLRKLMRSNFNNLSKLCESIMPKKVWVLSQYDSWQTIDTEVQFGIFDSFEKAKTAMEKEFGADGLSQLGDNKTWECESKDYTLKIYPVTLNVFEEIR